MTLQACMTFFHLGNTKEDVLENARFQTTLDPFDSPYVEKAHDIFIIQVQNDMRGKKKITSF